MPPLSPNLLLGALIQPENVGGDNMAAFCGCCGAEITEKAEACRVCGTPRHGMLRVDGLTALDLGDERRAEDARPIRPGTIAPRNETP